MLTYADLQKAEKNGLISFEMSARVRGLMRHMDDLRKLLSDFEFSDCGYCPTCGRDENWGHEHGCHFQSVLYGKGT